MDATSQPADKEQLHRMASQSAKCAGHNINPTVSKASYAHIAATDEHGKEAVHYDEEKGGYMCPAGALLPPYKAWCKKTYNQRYRNLEACLHCDVKDKCTVNKKGRTINDRPLQKHSREVDKRTEADNRASIRGG